MNLKQQNFYDNSLTQEQPSHPRISLPVPLKLNNLKLNQKIVKNQPKNSHIQVKTARQPFRTKQQNSTKRQLYSSRNSRAISIKAPSNNNSPQQNESQLFVPERKKINQNNKLPFKNATLNPRSASCVPSSRLRSSTISINFKDRKNKAPQLNNTLKNISLEQNSATIHKIAQLRKQQVSQKQRQIQLKNKLKFITIQKEKDIKRLQLVKRKYEKVVAVRSQFFKEKQSIQKRKIQNYLDDMNEKHRKISRVKQQKEYKRISVSQVSQNKSLQASRLRSEQKSIVEKLREQKDFELKKKRQSVRNSMLKAQKTHEKILQSNRSRIESLRSIQNKQIAKGYLNISTRQKMNEKLHQRLQKEIAVMNQSKKKSTNQLQQYEEFLGLRNKNSIKHKLIQNKKAEDRKLHDLNLQKINKSAKTSAISTSVSRSFYLTNY